MGNINADAIRTALKKRFPPLSHALMFEVAPATGGGTRYADAVAVGLWSSHGHMIQGIEIKVSRADFLHEMKQPEKSEPVMRYCGRWWLACPKGMVKPEELPPTWGMLELTDAGVLTPKVKAPILKPQPPTLAFFASLCRRRAGMDEAMSNTAIKEQVDRIVAEHKRRLDSDHANKLGYKQQSIVDAEARLLRIKAETGVDLQEFKAGDEVVQAIRFYRAAAKKAGWRGEFRNLLGALDDAAKAIREADLALPETES